MSDQTISLIRTVIPAAWSAVVVAVASRVGISLTDAQAVGVVVVVLGVVYRAARAAEARWPWMGRILLGSARQPTYDPPTAAIGDGDE